MKYRDLKKGCVSAFFFVLLFAGCKESFRAFKIPIESRLPKSTRMRNLAIILYICITKLPYISI